METNLRFVEALKNVDRTKFQPVIPDIKCFSPKDGDLMHGRNPVDIARCLERAKAPVLSVVTEEKEFHGSMDILKEICASVTVPVLRKDFIETGKDIEETKAAGASAMLLMYSCLGKEKLHELYKIAIELGVTPFVETHNKEELIWAAELNAPIIGINNRNILELERDNGDFNTSKNLLSYAPEGSLVISESSIKNGVEVRDVIKNGAFGALVGTALLNAPDLERAYRAISRRTGIKLCGIMNPEDYRLVEDYYVDIAGVVVDYPVNVPWNLELERAKEIFQSARSPYTKNVVVTGGSLRKAMNIANELKPDYIQIHYTETFKETDAIAEELKKIGVQAIRSIPLNPKSRREMFGTSDIQRIAKMLEESNVQGILFDSREAGNAAESGINISEADIASLLKGIAADSRKPVLIGGGITEDNVSDIVGNIAPDYIDIMSGSEDEPGKKSEAKIKALVSAVTF